jgi:hypothetical protein
MPVSCAGTLAASVMLIVLLPIRRESKRSVRRNHMIGPVPRRPAAQFQALVSPPTDARQFNIG